MKIVLLPSLILPLSAFADVFKSSDDQGNTIYSDIPSKKGDQEELELPQINISQSPKKKDLTNESNVAPKKKEQRSYKYLKISNPINGDTIRDNAGNVNISVTLDPVLAETKGDQLSITLDGKKINHENNQTVELKNIERGTHIIVATITNAKDKNINKSVRSTFHLIRTITKDRTLNLDEQYKLNPSE